MRNKGDHRSRTGDPDDAPSRPRAWEPKPHPPEPTPEQRARVQALIAELRDTLSMPSAGGRTDLPACEHCGHYPAVRASRIDGRFYARCPGCGSATAMCASREEAERVWVQGERSEPKAWWGGDNLLDARVQRHTQRLMARGIPEAQARRLARDLVASPWHRPCEICDSEEVPF